MEKKDGYQEADLELIKVEWMEEEEGRKEAA